ncbi:MAG: membrane protein insertase YidC [Bdellovibrionia bacterium]
MQSPNNPGFFDQKTLLAVIAVALIYGGWQYYLTQKYPSYGQNQPAATTTETQTNSTATTDVSNQNNPTVVGSESSLEAAPAVDAFKEEAFAFSGKDISFELTNLGMGLKNVQLKNYTDKEKNPIVIGNGKDPLFAMELASSGGLVPFKVVELSPGNFRGEAKIGEMIVVRELSYDSQKNSITNKVTFENATVETLKSFSFILPDRIMEDKNSSLLFPSYDLQDFFVIHSSETKETINFNHAKENVDQEFNVASTVAVGSQYFASALLDKSNILPKVKLHADVNSKNAYAKVIYEPAAVQSSMQFEQLMYVGPKSIDQLKKIDRTLAKIVDFGFFDVIATPFLYVMKFFYGLVGNWGLAIILLTLLVRFAVLPFNVMSFRSMKAMQKIQPSVQALREKYKEDPMRLNQEMMALMKQNGANPLGGCVPMLLQIPIFFALYRVISSSVELYQSPFIFWITDLSAYDKFYVLPVLMGVTMFVQQKLTPTTMDPTQAKIFLILPVVMSVFMLQLPSGLTLYMFVSTLFGIIQQMIIMRDSKPVSGK